MIISIIQYVALDKQYIIAIFLLPSCAYIAIINPNTYMNILDLTVNSFSLKLQTKQLGSISHFLTQLNS